MIPVNQTKLHNPEKGINGNCFRACIASILEVDIDSLPIFEDYFDLWPDVFVAWCNANRIDFCFTANPPNGYSIITGTSIRGVLHCCIAFDGVVVHDPHPSKVGLLEIRDYLTLEKI